MDFNILGPLELRGREGREIRLPAGRERSLLVLLLIHRGQVVSTDRIVDALWGQSPPETATKAVQGYVSHLRRLLEPEHEPGAGRGPLVTQPPGYALRADAVAVDAVRFEQLVADGRRALDDGSAAEAAQVLDEALGLWRGQALAEFAFDDFARDEIERLEELRLCATEDRIEALLRVGRHGEIVGGLGALVTSHPLRERLRGQWMLALYRSGRQADALQAYRDGRRLLASELGLEPGPELQRLERSILAHEPELEPPAPSVAPPRADEREEQPPRRSRLATHRGRIVVAGALAAGALAALVFAVAGGRDQAPAAVKVAAPAVVVIDASTNRVVASIPAGSKPAAIAAGEGGVWVGDAVDGTVTRIDPDSLRVVKTIGIGAPAIGLATGAGNVWVATGGFGMVVRIDSRLGAVTRRIELGEPGNPVVPTVTSVGIGEGRLWVGAFDGLVRIDPASGERLRRVDLDQNPALDIAIGGGAVWATTSSRRANRVDASSGQVTAEFYTGTFSLAIALDRSAVWLAGADAGQLWKIDPVTGSTLLTASAGHGSDAVALGSGAVWVASWRDHAIVRVDPATGDVVASIPVGGEPMDVAVRDGLVWAAVQPPPAAT
jgi:DNA-binding SARP family transcriptional activator/DNA-binding beta-propeller fold protein YncE